MIANASQVRRMCDRKWDRKRIAKHRQRQMQTQMQRQRQNVSLMAEFPSWRWVTYRASEATA